MLPRGALEMFNGRRFSYLTAVCIRTDYIHSLRARAKVETLSAHLDRPKLKTDSGSNYAPPKVRRFLFVCALFFESE